MYKNGFSEEVSFKNPCLSFVLRRVFCDHCNASKDMDFTRDKTLLRQDGEPSWDCNNCDNPIDKEKIEEALIEELGELITNYYVEL